ncbi:hypothetical protein HK100_004001 [Physocladia obscura]|uniref:MTOR-associated protein MEAK7 n=1 Tax=Physocladia obscura TaxID=109957 RepID=A0AAD5X919_9FUNG|nr:hypothetical protein HK100_004001 [Physocladia obscura]
MWDVFSWMVCSGEETKSGRTGFAALLSDDESTAALALFNVLNANYSPVQQQQHERTQRTFSLDHLDRIMSSETNCLLPFPLPPPLSTIFTLLAWKSMLLSTQTIQTNNTTNVTISACLSAHNWLSLAAILTNATWSDRAYLFADIRVCNSVDVALAFLKAANLATVSARKNRAFAKFLVSQYNLTKTLATAGYSHDGGGDNDYDDPVSLGSLDFLDAWAPQCPLFSALWDYTFRTFFFNINGNLGGDNDESFSTSALNIPLLSFLSSTLENQRTEFKSLLMAQDLFLLSSFIKASHQQHSVEETHQSYVSHQHWPLLYCSNIHGKSWGSFTSRIEAAGSFILAVKESSKRGGVFGAYCPVAIECSPKFLANDDAFLFETGSSGEDSEIDAADAGRESVVGVYLDQSINRNHVYFNYGMSTMPNGIGFGGQMSYFGLFLDTSLSFGTCSASPRSSTFNSPRFSVKNNERFEIDTVQAFLVHPKIVDSRLVPERRKGGTSVLNGHVLESALLEMVGRERYSNNV